MKVRFGFWGRTWLKGLFGGLDAEPGDAADYRGRRDSPKVSRSLGLGCVCWYPSGVAGGVPDQNPSRGLF